MIKVNGQIIEQKHFPDNSLHLTLDFTRFGGSLVVEWHYENDSELFTVICIKDYIDAHYPERGTMLKVPYLPHARMDRVKNYYDVFTLKSFCKVINNLHFDQVVVCDTHSNVSLGLLDRVSLQQPAYWIEEAKKMSGAEVMFYPDEGAMKRYSAMTKAPYSFGIKDRDWETGVIKGLNIMNPDAVKGKDVLIVDDICSRGGTFYHSAKALKEAGANKIYLYVTHLETTVFDGDLINSGLVEQIYTTDSIFPEDKKTDLITILKP